MTQALPLGAFWLAIVGFILMYCGLVWLFFEWRSYPRQVKDNPIANLLLGFVKLLWVVIGLAAVAERPEIPGPKPNQRLFPEDFNLFPTDEEKEKVVGLDVFIWPVIFLFVGAVLVILGYQDFKQIVMKVIALEL